MPAMTAEQAAEIEIPRWVPPELRGRYREHVERHGEEEAAAWARRTKAGETDRSEASIASAPDDGSSWWTEERVEAMRTMIAEGATRAAVAEALGTTRNVVVGKMDRLGLKRDDVRPVSKTKPEPVAKKVEAPPRRTSAPASAPVPLRPELPPSIEGVSIFDVKAFRCRWPVSGAGISIMFCGAPVKQTPAAASPCSFCAEHARLVFVPSGQGRARE